MASTATQHPVETVFQQLAVGKARQRVVEGHQLQAAVQLTRRDRGSQHLRQQLEPDDIVIAPGDLAAHHVESNESAQAFTAPQRHDQDRLDAFSFELATLALRIHRELCDLVDPHRLVGTQLLQQPGKGAERNVLQILGFGRNAFGHPLVRVALGTGFVVDHEHVGAIDSEQAPDRPQGIDDGAIELLMPGAHHRGRRNAQAMLELDARPQLTLQVRRIAAGISRTHSRLTRHRRGAP